MSEFIYWQDDSGLYKREEIVRCRDCRFYDTDFESIRHPGKWWCDESWSYREPDGFCAWGAWGERKDNGNS